MITSPGLVKCLLDNDEHVSRVLQMSHLLQQEATHSC